MTKRNGHKFILITEQGRDATVTDTYTRQKAAHFDTPLAAFEWARRRAEEDGASVLLQAAPDALWVDMSRRERGF